MVAHTTLLEISCTGSFVLKKSSILLVFFFSQHSIGNLIGRKTIFVWWGGGVGVGKKRTSLLISIGRVHFHF